MAPKCPPCLYPLLLLMKPAICVPPSPTTALENSFLMCACLSRSAATVTTFMTISSPRKCVLRHCVQSSRQQFHTADVCQKLGSPQSPLERKLTAWGRYHSKQADSFYTGMDEEVDYEHRLRAMIGQYRRFLWNSDARQGNFSPAVCFCCIDHPSVPHGSWKRAWPDKWSLLWESDTKMESLRLRVCSMTEREALSHLFCARYPVLCLLQEPKLSCR